MQGEILYLWLLHSFIVLNLLEF